MSQNDIAFAEKYRPKTLGELLVKHSTKMAIEAVAKNLDTTSVIMLCGPSGYGKTTVARIFASTLLNGNVTEFNCIEVNAANQRGIDDTRSLVDFLSSNSLFAQGKKVVILNEAHQLTDAAQKCLLDPMEGNSNVCFIITTTDPSKIIDTIKTRSVIINFILFDPINSINDSLEVKKYMVRILAKENYSLSKEALDLVVKSNPNSIRQFVIKLGLIIGADIHDLTNDLKTLINGAADIEYTTALDLARLITDKKYLHNPDAKLHHWFSISNKVRSCNINPETTRRTIAAYLNSVVLNSLAKTQINQQDFEYETRIFFRHVRSLEIFSSRTDVTREQLLVMIIRSLFPDNIGAANENPKSNEPISK